MAIKQGQMRYVKDGDSRNYPTNLTAEMLTTGAMFSNAIRISDLTISGGFFGIKFFLNDTPTALSTRVGDLTQLTERGSWSLNTNRVTEMPIYSVRFEAESIQKFLTANALLSKDETPFYIFIDYSYETTA